MLVLWLSLLGMGEPVTIDYAEAAQRDAWLRHPVLGDPSFDAFLHANSNPVVRGKAPYEWPVNGFLFEDPVSNNWYLYVGEYCSGYAMKLDAPSRCVVYRSTDRGEHWDLVGPLFPEPFTFEDEVSPTTHAPDVSVVFEDGRYHLCFDWCTDNTTWENAANPLPDSNSGAAYAWAERPEGPFHPASRPIATTRAQKPLAGKYRRLYASSIVRRANDWLVLTLTDSGPYFGWALLGMTSEKPEGPYSEPRLLLHPESERYHPPLLEFFPAFTHDGFVYAPATSVAMNRNFQALFRAPLEKATEPEAWELYQEGSVWHSEPLEHEWCGIWGQTFSGFIGSDGIFHVMFPSRDSHGNGTINLAARPWNKPFNERGFVISGHDGPSITCLKRGGPLKSLAGSMRVNGTVTVVWDYQGAMGADRPASGSTLHVQTLTRYTGLEFSDNTWRVVCVNDRGECAVAAEGKCDSVADREFRIDWVENGQGSVNIDGKEVFTGALPNGPGLVGLLTVAHSNAAVSKFTVEAEKAPAKVSYLYTDALLGGAQNMADWEKQENGLFRFGQGVCSKRDGLNAKWSVIGSHFALWAPKGPSFGKAELLVDGKTAAIVDLHAESEVKSQDVHSSELTPGRHVIVVRTLSPGVPVDSIEVTF